MPQNLLFPLISEEKRCCRVGCGEPDARKACDEENVGTEMNTSSNASGLQVSKGISVCFTLELNNLECRGEQFQSQYMLKNIAGHTNKATKIFPSS